MEQSQPPLFRILEEGLESVIEFDSTLTGNSVPSVQLKAELKEFFEASGCRKLIVECSSRKYLPGGILGILASFHGKGPEICLVNASPDIVSTMKASRLDERIHVQSHPSTDANQ